MMEDYEPPHVVSENIFVEQLGEDGAPPHRWFLIGPKRSGSEVHQDPLGTSAWNTSVKGHKRWVMMPPNEGLTKSIVRGKDLMQRDEDDQAIQYFDFVLPRVKQHYGPEGNGLIKEIIEGI